MKPEEKAKELIEKYSFCITTYKGTSIMHKEIALHCALIAVNAIIKALHAADTAYDLVNDIYYWQQVKAEIEKLKI